MERLTTAPEEGNKKKPDTFDHMGDVPVDEHGEVAIPSEIVIGRTQGLFGEKIYEELGQAIAPAVDEMRESSTADEMTQSAGRLIDTVTDTIKQNVVAPLMEEYAVSKGTQKRMERQIEQEIERKFQPLKGDFVQRTQIAKTELERRWREADTEEQQKAAENDYKDIIRGLTQDFAKDAEQLVQKTIEEKPKEIVEKLEHHKAEQEKRSIEDDIRSHLRGFSRTIPSFIMAYGDGNLTLANFDDYTEDDVFHAVTGITEEDFRFLRDGGDRVNPDTGEIEHFDGHLFDEVVFNDSVAEFWHKKQELANYFDESHDEDIFDYIPPQKTNQIFTPKLVERKMVADLEANTRGCFDDPANTFADLYMKSGLYITEIVKRLFRSEGLKAAYPDEGERIRHILRHQVYGMAPTRIIYLIATNYILGFDEQLKSEATHNVQEDNAEDAQEER